MRKYLSLTILFISLSLTFAQTAILPSGSGTEVDPYLIASLDNLYWLTQNTDKWGNFYYRQTANIDASSTNTWSWTDSYDNTAEGLKSIGDDVVSSFFGTYDGQGFSIDGLYIRRKTVNNIGLFGNTWDATIKDLTLTNVSIASYYEGTETNIQYDFIGALVGTANGTKITNCNSSGHVTGGGGVGGLVGYLSSTENNGGNIENCSSTCTVSGVKWIGGFIGYNFESIIKNSYSSGTVIGSSDISEDVHSTGGFIGQNAQYSEIYRSYSTGSVTGENNVGGFVGANVDSYIFDCYSKGNVSGTNSVGGFIGYYNSDYVKNCYSTGSVSGNDNIGGLVGFNNNSQIENCFWDTETSELSTSAGGTGKTTLEMQTETTFTDAGWNFDTVWTMNGYPDLMVNPLPIELSSFSISIIKNGTELNWETATEINNYGFNVERRTETGDWNKVGFVEGHGNSNSPKYYSYNDKLDADGETYFYRLKQIDINGQFEYSNVVEITIGTPHSFKLNQNYPNPFNPTTTIKYSIPSLEQLDKSFYNVELKVYDVLGKEIATLVNQQQTSGNYRVIFNASNLPSGTYFYTVIIGDFSNIKKMILLK